MPSNTANLRRRLVRRALAASRGFAIGLSVAVLGAAAGAGEQPFGLDHRVPWTTSRVVGSPEPPPPYVLEKTFTNVPWRGPLYLAAEPGTDRLFVVERGGEGEVPSRILRVRGDPAGAEVETLLEIKHRLIYGLTFHPGYETNGLLFVFSNGPWGKSDRTNRVSRFTVSRRPPQRCDPASERIILEWRSAGHDGGDLAFGGDGMLYIASGDGTSDSDGWLSGQDMSDLLAALLRIDVDHPDPGRAYSVPPDNPFVSLGSARPEIWAYGFRNPWRLTIDRPTGQVWVGNNGQDLWETAHLVRRGENYGWSVYEGSQPFYLNRPRGPTPIVKPTLEHHHSEFRSLTGGVVYRGKQWPELDGVYVYGDYSTGRIWGARHNGERLTWQGELAVKPLQICGFGVDQRGDLLVADLGGGIYRLAKRPKEKGTARFPTRLSDTGLFRSVKEHRMQDGVIPYSVNAPGWNDGAEAERHLALPGDAKITHKASRGWDLPDGAVLVQTLSLELEAGKAASRRRLETRLLVRQQGEWAGYSYQWNASQTDATLVPRQGTGRTVLVKDPSVPGGQREQVWRYPGRTECLVCHSRAANFVLGLSTLQMDRDHDYGGVRDNQLRTLEHIGMFARPLPASRESPGRLIDPYNPAGDLEARARSYLHANCSVCHVEAGGGNAKMELEITTAKDRMNLLDARPQHDTFGLDNAMLLAPGDPGRSVLLWRLSHRGPGQMPPLVTAVVDRAAVQLFRDWIARMPPARRFVREWAMADLLPALDQVQGGRSFESGQSAFREVGCGQCHRFAGEGGSVGPDLTGVGRRLSLRDTLESILDPSKVIAESFATTEIETRDGRLIAGRIESEDGKTIALRTNSEMPERLVLGKQDVLRRRQSKVSNMPTGIVNVLTRDQVLDLLAYLLSDGNGGEPRFGK